MLYEQEYLELRARWFDLAREYLKMSRKLAHGNPICVHLLREWRRADLELKVLEFQREKALRAAPNRAVTVYNYNLDLT